MNVLRMAYADPPYLGCGALYDHPDAKDWNDPQTHRRLIERLGDEFKDGWALSCSSPSLRALLAFAPADTRIGAWVKPFAIFKPNVGVAYAWEPVLFRGGRRRTRQQPTVRDWVSANVTLKKGLTGAKPPTFADYIFDILNLEPQDEFVDLFPGTGAVGEAWRRRQNGSLF